MDSYPPSARGQALRGKTVWDRGLVADEGWVANRLYRRRMLSGTEFTPILTFPHQGGRDLLARNKLFS